MASVCNATKYGTNKNKIMAETGTIKRNTGKRESD